MCLPVSGCSVTLPCSYQWQLGALKRTLSWRKGTTTYHTHLAALPTDGKAHDVRRSPVPSNLVGNHPGYHRQLPVRRAAPGTLRRHHHMSQPRWIPIPNPKTPSPRPIQLPTSPDPAKSLTTTPQKEGAPSFAPHGSDPPSRLSGQGSAAGYFQRG